MQTTCQALDSQTVAQQGFDCEELRMDMRKLLADGQVPSG